MQPELEYTVHLHTLIIAKHICNPTLYDMHSINAEYLGLVHNVKVNMHECLCSTDHE